MDLDKLKQFLHHDEKCSVMAQYSSDEGWIEHNEGCAYVDSITGESTTDPGVAEDPLFPCPCGLVCSCGLWNIFGIHPRDWSLKLDRVALQNEIDALRQMDKEDKKGPPPTMNGVALDREVAFGCGDYSDADDDTGCSAPPTKMYVRHHCTYLRCEGHTLTKGKLIAKIGKTGKLSPA